MRRPLLRKTGTGIMNHLSLLRRLIGICLMCLALPAAAAVPQSVIEKLALGEGEDKIAAVGEVVAAAEPEGLVLLQSLMAGEVQVLAEKKRVFIVRDGKAMDAVTGAEVWQQQIQQSSLQMQDWQQRR